MALRKRGGGGGVTFLNLLQKEGVPRKGGFPQKRGVLTLEKTMDFSLSPYNDEKVTYDYLCINNNI